MAIEIKVLGAGDEAILAAAAPRVFDRSIDNVASKEFLADPRNHIVVAIEDGAVVGFVSAVHYTHPDKPRPELWIDEVGVSPTHHRRGLGKTLIRSMLEVGRQLGCAQAWVLTDRANSAAMRLYASIGGVQPAAETVMFLFVLSEPRSGAHGG